MKRTEDLTYCPRCRRDLVCPQAWEEFDGQIWELRLRCGECRHERIVVVNARQGAALDGRLDDQAAELAELADRLAGERMATWIDTFTRALERDLLGADDFRPRRPRMPARIA